MSSNTSPAPFGGPPDRQNAGMRSMMIYDANKKSVGVAYLLWFFVGGLGGHRFYLRRTGTAVAMLLITLVSIPLTSLLIGYVGFAVIGVWAVIDAFLIPGMTRDFNNQLINQLA